MKKHLILLVTAVTILFFSSCRKVTGEGQIETEVRMHSNFSGIQTGIPITIYFTRSSDSKVQIKAQRNILNIIRTSVEGNNLNVDFRSNTIVKSYTPIELHISSPSLEEIHMDCSGTVQVKGTIVTNNLLTEISSTGSLIIDSVQIANELKAEVNGSGSINILSGQTATEDISINGRGHCDAGAVKAVYTVARINGSGYARVYPLQTLSAYISGRGDLYYFGNPVISSHISGSGKIVKL